MSTTSPSTAWIKAGLVALPVYGLITGYTTRLPQPDQTLDPGAWARFVSSPSYLAEHVASNVVGALLAIFGTLALGALLTRGHAVHVTLWGTVLTVAGQTLLMVPGTITTFATPAIGAAYLTGRHEVMAIEFSPLLSLIILLALLLTVVGNVLLGVAIWRSSLLWRWAGVAWIAAVLVFYVLGAALGMATTGASLPTQPVGGVLMAISGAVIAWSVFRRRPTGRDRTRLDAPASTAGAVGNGVQA